MTKKPEFKDIPVDQLEICEYNPNEMTQSMEAHLKRTMKQRGFQQPLTVTPKENAENSYIVIDGAHRLVILRKMDRKLIPCWIVYDKKELDIMIDILNLKNTHGDHNPKKVAKLLQNIHAEYDRDQIKALLNMDLAEQEMYDALLKQDEFKEKGVGRYGSLSEDYIVPPFSVLDSRKGSWLNRKREWFRLLNMDELGKSREGLLNMSKTVKIFKKFKNKEGKIANPNVSTFDPVLAEIICLWFCPKKGSILDPFAGDVSQSIVAAIKGHHFSGIEIRPEQIDVHLAIANRLAIQDRICFFQGDALERLSDEKNAALKPDEIYDLLFSCPPYYDLEKYSDDPKDLSNMSEEDYDKVMAAVIKKAAKKLKPNRFAVWVVGEVRKKSGIGQYKGLVPKTIKWFEDAGLRYYDEMILINSAGTLPMRIRLIWESSRKIGKMHQNILIFYKGNGSKMKELIDLIGKQDMKDILKEAKDGE